MEFRRYCRLCQTKNHRITLSEVRIQVGPAFLFLSLVSTIGLGVLFPEACADATAVTLYVPGI